jgi:SAM-dependent methyltransferase
VADAQDLHMVEANSVDLVLAFNVLEHVRHPHRVIAECERILKPGGIVWIDVPFMYPFHADPDDFYRFSDHGLAIACERFEKLECTFLRGPASCMAELTVQFVAVLFSFNSRRVHAGVEYGARWLFSWIKYLDWFIAHYETARVIHASTTFIGRKRAPLPG